MSRSSGFGAGYRPAEQIARDLAKPTPPINWEEVGPELLRALKAADQFITNGIELGYIRMPNPGTPDPAHLTPVIVRAAISKATITAGSATDV